MPLQTLMDSLCVGMFGHISGIEITGWCDRYLSNFEDVKLFTSVLNHFTLTSTSFQIPLYFHFPAESLAAKLHFSLMKQKDTSGHLRTSKTQ